MKMGIQQDRADGFTLIELLISLSVFLIISGAVLGGMASMQKNYRGLEIRSALQQRMRAALELMTQEINQAGLPTTSVDQNALVNGPLTVSSSNIAAGASSATLTVASTTGIYQNQQLWLDVGTAQEAVQVDSMSGSTLTVSPYKNGVLTNAHNGGTTAFPIFTMGVYGNGILPTNDSGMTNYPPAAGQSSTYQLELFGDLNASGSGMLFVRYLCPAPGTTGPLKRTVWNVWDSTKLQDTDLLDNVTFCEFSYPNPVSPGVLGPGSDFALPLITTVSINITAQSATKDPQTGAYITATKSFLNLQPRSINAAVRRAIVADHDASSLQVNPAAGIFASLP